MIKLEVLKVKDYMIIVKWNEDKSSDFLLQWAGPVYKYPLTLEQIDQYVKNQENTCHIYKIIDIENNLMIGTIELNIKDEEGKVGRVGRFLIGEESCRGKGIGEQVLLEIVRIGFNHFGLNEITLGVFDFNTAAVRCYEKVGFRTVAHNKNCRKSSDGYWSLYEMSIRKDEWLKG